MHASDKLITVGRLYSQKMIWPWKLDESEQQVPGNRDLKNKQSHIYKKLYHLYIYIFIKHFKKLVNKYKRFNCINQCGGNNYIFGFHQPSVVI